MNAADFDAETARLIDLLVLWHRYESQWTPVQGYPPECPSCSDYLTSRQYDDGNGAFETDARGRLAGTVAFAVHSIDEPYRTALSFVARNRATGAQVWMSPRLPADDEARAEIVAEAMDRLGRLV